MSHSLDILECLLSTSPVNLLICITSSYSVAQHKDLPCNVNVRTNIVNLDGFYISILDKTHEMELTAVARKR